MPRKPSDNHDDMPAIRPMTEPQAREDQMIALAEKVAEEQMLNRTASSAVICHYLKLGSSKNKLELEALRQQNELSRVKTEAIRAQQEAEDLYMQAIKAFMGYSGRDEYPMPDLSDPDFGFNMPVLFPVMP